MFRSGLTLVLALSATVLSGQSGDDPAENQITIYTQFEHPPGAGPIEHMKTELDEIMASLGLRFDWRSLEAANGREVMAEILVVSFKGTCRSGDLGPEVSRGGALGWTHISDGEVLPFTDVDCDKIRVLLTSPLASVSSLERERMLGRAMARVLAHEMYHFFTNSTKHAATGIAKAFYSSRELASLHLGFEQAQVREVRAGRLRSLLGAMHRAAAVADLPAGGG